MPIEAPPRKLSENLRLTDFFISKRVLFIELEEVDISWASKALLALTAIGFGAATSAFPQAASYAGH